MAWPSLAALILASPPNIGTDLNAWDEYIHEEVDEIVEPPDLRAGNHNVPSPAEALSSTRSLTARREAHDIAE